MTRNNRRLLYLLFILVFFVVAPILVLYSSGYRPDWTRKRLIKTSVINLNTQPKGAEIWLNGIDQQKKTPAILTNIIPGTYDIKLVKDGFLPWQNTITVRTSRASVLYSIVLFRDTPSQLIFNGNILQIKKIIKDDQFLLVTENGATTELQLVNIHNGSTTVLVNKPGLITIETEPMYGQAVISQSTVPGGFELVNTDQPNTSSPLDYLPEAITNLQWLNRDTLIGQNGDALCQILLTKNTVACSQNDVSQFFIQGAEIYYLINDEQKSYLHRSSDVLETNPPLATLPLSENYTLLSTENKQIIIADKLSGELFIIEPQGTVYRQIKINNAAKDGFWLRRIEQFVYYNDYEIWRYDPKTANHQLLQRVSEPIHSVAQLADLPYLLLSRADNIESFELSEYTPMPTITPLVTNANGWFTTTSDGTLLFQDASERARLWSRALY